MSERKKVGSFSIGIGVRNDLFGIIPASINTSTSRATGVRLEIQWTSTGPVEVYTEKGTYVVYSDGATVTVEKTPLAKPVTNVEFGYGNIDFSNPEHVEWMKNQYSS